MYLNEKVTKMEEMVDKYRIVTFDVFKSYKPPFIAFLIIHRIVTFDVFKYL